MSANTNDIGPQPGPDFVRPDTPAHRWLEEANAAASSDWIDGFNKCAELRIAPSKGGPTPYFNRSMVEVHAYQYHARHPFDCLERAAAIASEADAEIERLRARVEAADIEIADLHDRISDMRDDASKTEQTLRARLDSPGHRHIDGAHLSGAVDGCLLCEAMAQRDGMRAENATLRARVAEWEQKAANWIASPEATARLDGYRELAQRLNAADARVAELEREIAFERLPKLPTKSCPSGSQCLHFGECVRRCDEAFALGIGLDAALAKDGA